MASQLSRKKNVKRSSVAPVKADQPKPTGRNEWDSGWVEFEARETWSLNEDWAMDDAQVRTKEHENHVDQVKDLVPFWIRSMEAAERGEELKLETFLENLTVSSWPNQGWGGHASNGVSGSHEIARIPERGSYEFVEEVALRQSVNDDRKREMHSFFAMPTNEKLKRIDALIRDLHDKQYISR